MKNNIRRFVALAMVLAMLLSMSALAAKETASGSFKLPQVLKRETELPAEEPTPVETPEAEEPAAVIGTAYVVLEQADSTLNVRAAASTEAERLGALNYGDAVSILGHEGEWTIIQFGGASGYVKSSFLADKLPEVVEELPEEPAADQPEAPAEEPKAEEKAPAKQEKVEVTENTEAAAEGPVAVGETDVRLEGDGLSEIFLTIPDGTALTVLAVEGDWVKVEIDGQIGYIYKDSVLGVEFEEPAAPEVDPADPEAAAPARKITIFSSRRSVMSEGEPVYLTSKLEGYEGYEIRYQWECDKGAGFEDVEGANDATYTFAATAETLCYNWRLTVFYR